MAAVAQAAWTGGESRRPSAHLQQQQQMASTAGGQVQRSTLDGQQMDAHVQQVQLVTRLHQVLDHLSVNKSRD